MVNWDFKYRPDREFAWEDSHDMAGLSALSASYFYEVYSWCNTTFGLPVPNGVWDHYAGWIKFRERKHVDLFLLKWQ